MMVEKPATESLKNQDRFLFLWPFCILLLPLRSRTASCSQPVGSAWGHESRLCRQGCGGPRVSVILVLSRWPPLLSFPDVTSQALFTCLLRQEYSQDKQQCGVKNRVYFALFAEYSMSLKLRFHRVSSGKQLPVNLEDNEKINCTSSSRWALWVDRWR